MQTIKRGTEFTGYLIFRHKYHRDKSGAQVKGCGAATRLHVGKYWFQGYQEDGKTQLSKDAHTKRVKCGGGELSVWVDGGQPIYGRFVSEIICDGRCMGAVGHSCDCSCGGMNHGGSNKTRTL